MTFLAFVIICVAFSISVPATDGQFKCISPQLLELGKYGLLKCSFSKYVYGIYWFNSTNILDNQPIISSQKDETKYNFREFDIHDNGSLIIKNVSLSHELTFAVLVLETEDAEPITTNVEVQVIVKPGVHFPVIDKCTNNERICLYKMNQVFEVRCSVGYSRPNLALIWKVRTPYGDEAVSSERNQTITIDLKEKIDSNDLWFSSSLILIICKVDDNPFALEYDTSLLLVQNTNKTFTKKPTITVVFNRYDNFVLDCNFFDNGVVVWEFARSANEDYETILYAGIGQENFLRVYKSDKFSENNGSLVASSPDFENGGIYQCTSSNGIYHEVKIYETICVVLPSPPFPVIDGCNNTKSGCVLYFDEHRGSVTCSVIGIFPKVELSIILASSENPNVINFYNQERGSDRNGATYTISLMSQFNVEPTFMGQITMMCLTTASRYEQLNVQVKFNLNFSRAKRNQDDIGNRRKDRHHLAWLSLLILLPVILIAVLFLIWKSRQKRTPERSENSEENIPLQIQDKENGQSSQTKTTERSEKDEETVPIDDQDTKRGDDLKTTFIQQLKSTYKNLYNAVKPLPHINTVMQSVNDLYVHGRIQFLDSRRKWKDMKSPNEIITDERIEKRCIIEGPPGYGKSILCLQLTYSWCNDVLMSLPCVDLLLFFRGRELKDICTLTQAIKQLLLPTNSEIQEEAIGSILRQFDSKVIVFDGFDEMKKESTLLADFLNNEHDFRVIVTTRSSCLPRSYLPSTTLIRLVGFNDIDRNEYINKAFKDDDKNVKEEVQRQLEISRKEDSIFVDLLKVPFFFVVVVHNWKGGKSARNQTSATQTIQLLVSSLINHMKTKRAYQSQNTNSEELPTSDNFNKAVFTSITSKTNKHWSERYFRHQFGDNVYNSYKNVGIIEMVTHESPSSNETYVPVDYQDNFDGVSMVIIRHMFFQEWFAANYIASTLKASKTEEGKTLVKLAIPVDNILRFASGIDTATASEIIKILLPDEEAIKLAISCVMEVNKEEFLSLKEHLSRLCQSSVEIDVTDNLYIQRKLRDFIMSVSHKIPSITFPSVILRNSFDSVDERRNNIVLKSRLKLPSDVATMELCIVQKGGEFTLKEIEQMIDYISKSKMIKELSLERCLVPMNLESVTAGYKNLHEVFEVSSLTIEKETLSDFRLKWRPEGRAKRFTWYRLNPSGHWEDYADNEEIAEPEYQRLLETIKESQRYQPFSFVLNR